MDMFYTCKTAVPEWFANRDPDEPKMRELLQMGLFLPLPDLDPQGRQIVIIRTCGHDPHTTGIEKVFKATHMISDIMCDEIETLSITGFTQILDMAGGSLAHNLQMTPAVAKKAMTVWQ
ncbi:hypothetical protein HAZT_HAZT007294, partial [Hyalella azteca]